MRVRGVAHPSSGGASGVRGTDAWVMSVTLAPWRAPDGVLTDGQILVWRWCANVAALRAAQLEIPFAGAVVEIEVSAPERIRGLDFRARATHEFELVAWIGKVDDPELRAFAETLAPPATVEHPDLGTFTWDARLERYETQRKSKVGVYALSVDPEDARHPMGDLSRAALRVGAFEADFAALRIAVARHVYSLWTDDWRDQDEPVVALEEFAARLPLHGLTVGSDGRLAVAYFGDAEMFGRHSIEVTFDEAGRVADANLVG